MIYIIFLIICFGASVIGAICGIGGGVIIKPVLDAYGVLDVSTISFLSGCTVLSMTTYSVTRSKINGKTEIDQKTLFPLSGGAAMGGLIGHWLFSYIKSMSADPNKVGAIQAICLLIVTIGTLIYTIYRDKIKTYQINSKLACIFIGLFLGVLSSFLGIGGGPINLVVLFFFFSMNVKDAAQNSLYIIFFSQLTSLISSIVTGTIPDFGIGLLFVMIAGGIAGGACGCALNKKIDEKSVAKLFIALMVVMIIINAYNIHKLL